jgi:hypothetical protein
MPTYTARTTRTISVDVQKDGGAGDGTEPWTVYAASPFGPSDFTEAGTGDETLTGPIYDGREYRIVFDPIGGYATPSAANITASATPQTFVGNYVTASQETRDLDVNGWTIFIPAVDTRQIHVSNAGNDTTGDGSESTPYLTIARGQQDIRSGFADWLLLRRGDVFYEYLGTPKSGRSRTEPTLYSSYGASSARPELWTNQSQPAIGGYEGSGPRNVCFVGIKFYSYTRDPDNNPGDYLGGNSRAAISWGISPSGTPNLSGVLFEDCWFQHYHSMSIYGSTNGNISFTDLEFRRTLITDFWIDEPGSEHSEGFYSRNATMKWHQCILDHNGWRIQGESPGTNGADGRATYFNHNTYFARNCSETEITECVSMRPSANHNKWTGEDGAGSVVDLIENNNLKIDGEIGIDVGGNSSAAYRFVDPTITNNVITEIGRSNSTGRNIAWGIETADWDGGTCSGNLVVHQRFSRNTYPINLRTSSGSRNWSFNNNIVHGMASAGAAVRVIGTNSMTGCTATGNILQSTHSTARCWDFDGTTSGFTFNTDEVYSLASVGAWHRGDGSVKSTAQWNTDTGDSATSNQTAFVDDTRSIETYMTHISETPATVEQFYVLQRQQSKANWRTELTAPVINDWFRAGFTKA